MEYAAAQYLVWTARRSRWDTVRPVKSASATEYLLCRILHVDQVAPGQQPFVSVATLAFPFIHPEGIIGILHYGLNTGPPGQAAALRRPVFVSISWRRHWLTIHLPRNDLILPTCNFTIHFIRLQLLPKTKSGIY